MAVPVGRGGAGSSAARMGQQQRAVERAGQKRLAVRVLPVAAAVAVLLMMWAGSLGLLFGLVLLAVAAWRIYRPTGSSWSTGAAGERRTAKMMLPLQRDGWTALHDRAIPNSKANLDHLLISPAGEVVYVDTKTWTSNKSALRVQDGQLWYGKYAQTRALDTVVWEAGQAARVLGVPVTPYIAVHGASVPYGQLTLQGVTLVDAKTLVRHLRNRAPAPLAPGVIPHQLAQRAEQLLPPA